MSEVTSFRWPINNLKQIYDLEKRAKSDVFSLKNYPSAKFALILDGRFWYNARDYPTLRLVSLNASAVNQIKFYVKLWLENADGGKFNEQTEAATFKTVDSACILTWTDLGKAAFKNIYDAQQSLILCCEIKNAEQTPSPPIPSSSPLSRKMWKLYLEQRECDAIIEVEDKEFKIHRNIFIVQSEVFRTMFASGFEEGLSNKVKIKNCSVPSVEALIRWFYLGEIENQAIVEDLFVLADMYMVEDLKAQSAWFMLQDLSEQNAAYRLSLAITHKSDALKDHILDFIKNLDAEKICQIYQSPEWRDFLNSKQSTSGNVE